MFFFFFSSRRRHTRWPRDWSSDVCSSDLPGLEEAAGDGPVGPLLRDQQPAREVDRHAGAAAVVVFMPPVWSAAPRASIGKTPDPTLISPGRIRVRSDSRARATGAMTVL